MTKPFDYFKAASNQTLIDRHENYKAIPHCKSCNRTLDEDDIKQDGLAFGICSVCRQVAETYHRCCSCDNGTAAPGKTLCQRCVDMFTREAE